MDMETGEDLAVENEEVDEAYEEYLRANLIRDEELISFVEDFMNSEEYHSIIAKSKEEVTVDIHLINCVCTDCWKDTEKIDLVREAQKIWAIERRFEKFLKSRTTKEIVKHQEESIRIIREKIAEAKQKYLCHKDERDLLKKKRRENVLETLKEFHVNTTYLPIKSKVIDKVLAYDKIRHVQRLKRKQRKVNIIKKILNEYGRQRQIEELKNKRYDTKVVRKEKILHDVEVIGTKIELLPRPKPELENPEEKVEEAEWEEIVKPEEIKQKKDKKCEKDKKDKGGKKGAKKDKVAKKSNKGKDPKKNKKDKGKGKKEKKDKKSKSTVSRF